VKLIKKVTNTNTVNKNQDSKVTIKGIKYIDPALKIARNEYLSIEENFII
jgi:hypothetical protein